MKTENEFNDEINELEESLTNAISAAENLRQKLKSLYPNESRRICAVLDSYTIAWLNNFLEDENQMGSLVNLKKTIEEEFTYDDEDTDDEE